MEGLPLWSFPAKYRAVLQVVLAANQWDAKYPLLENIIDGLLAKERESAERRGREKAVEYIRENRYLFGSDEPFFSQSGFDGVLEEAGKDT